MLIRSLRLRNIRSYIDERIVLSEGMTLLSGDIGSGKSTILLALEFALFGIQRGELSGASLLRHGCRTGSVTLSLRLGDKEVEIVRGLKRNDTAVSQDAGTLTVDGVTVDGTAQELKARVLELLNYPPSLLKGKGPLFRYTVYTPQEEMKAILYERPDTRLDTLRKLFDLDRYKRARENAALLLRDLRKADGELAARIEELGRDAADLAQLERQLAVLEGGLAAKEKLLAVATKGLAAQRAALDAAEKERFAVEELKKRHAVLLARSDATKARAADLATQRDSLKAQVEATAKGLSPLDIDPAALAAEEKRLSEFRLKLKEKERAIVKAESAQEAVIAAAEKVVSGISSLTDCPTCRQPVDESHKRHIRDDEGKKVADAKQRLGELAGLKRDLAAKEDSFEKKRAELFQKQKLVEANTVKLAALDEQKQRLGLQEGTLAKLAEQLAQMAAEEKRLAAELGTRTVDEDAYRAARKAADEAQAAESGLKVAVAELRRDAVAAAKEIARAKERALERDRREQERQRLRQRLDWLEHHFLAVAYAVEKALFHSVYGLFNDSFKEWFSLLLEDETISVRLDAEFTPLIVQDGYETGIEQLSGGEKTSVALAYRLALTRATNEFLSSVNTRDLLILDEPTDGFSSEQLDRVREVLHQLRLKQVIIVSHEAQMEGFVDHVLRVRKQGHESKVEA